MRAITQGARCSQQSQRNCANSIKVRGSPLNKGWEHFRASRLRGHSGSLRARLGAFDSLLTHEPPKRGVPLAAWCRHDRGTWRLIVSILEVVPSVTRAAMPGLDSHVWRTTMDAALRVHRYHAAKVERMAVHSVEPSERSADKDASDSMPASAES